MVSAIRIYFEGDARLRPGFHSFLSSIVEMARTHKISINLIACESTPIEDFMKAIEAHPDASNFLLIDTEGPDDGKLLINIKAHDHWNPPNGMVVSDNQIHFMTQIMESWFLSDKEALDKFYGKDFRTNKLPDNPEVEKVSKEDVLNTLKAATRERKKGAYHKTRHAPELLRACFKTQLNSV